MALRLIVCVILGGNLRQIIVCFAVFYTMKCINSFSFLLLAMATPLITPKTTSFISKANYSPPSSGNHRSLFVKLAKRGKQRAGGEALYALHYFTFNYQQRHPNNCFNTQLRWYCAIIPMDEFRNINAFMVQLGTGCSFDSPGLARDEPTPGKHPQGDSTP